MLFHLLFYLYPSIKIMNVVRYITFRAALATLTALLISLALGPGLIRRLREFQIGQQIRPEGPLSHQSKKGTPTMGGLLILIGVILPSLLWADPANPYVWIVLISTLLFGIIGLADDYLKITRKRSLGLTARQTLAAEWTVALGCGTLVGASLGILCFNCNPAEVFMGDVGAMAIGGSLGTIAFIIKQELLLVFVGGLFVIKAASVIIQVASFRLRGKRVFRMA